MQLKIPDLKFFFYLKFNNFIFELNLSNNTTLTLWPLASLALLLPGSDSWVPW